MIKLAASALTDFAHLAAPPTHAFLTSRNVVYLPWNKAHSFCKVNYQLGTLDATGEFVPNLNTGPIESTLPKPYAIGGADTYAAALAVLLEGGQAPATELGAALHVSAKKPGDHKIVDLDMIFCAWEPRLAGTVV